MIDDVKLSVFSNAVVEFLRDRLKLNPTGNQLLSMIVLNTIIWLNHNIDDDSIKHIIDTILQIHYMVIGFIGLSIYLNRELIRDIIHHRYNKSNDDDFIQPTLVNENQDEYIVIDISNIPKYIMSMYKYISLKQSYFDTNVDSKYIIYIEDAMIPLYNNKLHFNDENYEVFGFITTKYSLTMVKEQKVHNYTMLIHIDKKSKALENNNSIDYIKFIMKYLDDDLKYGSRIQLYYYKILHDKLIKTTYYDADVETWEKDVKLLRESFFSEHNETLFNVIDNKIRGTNIVEAQAWNNLLLHSKQGGLGKSSVIYRSAIMLKKNVLSIDIAQFINKKNDLYSIFHFQKFKLPIGGETVYDIDNYIIVLEEFDHAIEKLYHIDKFNKIKYELKKKRMRCQQQGIENATRDLLKASEVNTEIIENSGSTMDPMQKLINSEIGHPRSYPKSNKQQYTNNITMINNDIQDILNENSNTINQNIVYLGDLLELFQGPIHIVDRIIIATTNNIEIIRNALPMLIRPGRLTPIKFDYLNWDIFSKLVSYYIAEMPEIEPFEITVPTSQIVELAIKHKNANDENTNAFIEEMRELCAQSKKI